MNGDLHGIGGMVERENDTGMKRYGGKRVVSMGMRKSEG